MKLSIKTSFLSFFILLASHRAEAQSFANNGECSEFFGIVNGSAKAAIGKESLLTSFDKELQNKKLHTEGVVKNAVAELEKEASSVEMVPEVVDLIDASRGLSALEEVDLAKDVRRLEGLLLTSELFAGSELDRQLFRIRPLLENPAIPAVLSIASLRTDLGLTLTEAEKAAYGSGIKALAYKTALEKKIEAVKYYKEAGFDHFFTISDLQESLFAKGSDFLAEQNLINEDVIRAVLKAREEFRKINSAINSDGSFSTALPRMAHEKVHIDQAIKYIAERIAAAPDNGTALKNSKDMTALLADFSRQVNADWVAGELANGFLNIETREDVILVLRRHFTSEGAFNRSKLNTNYGIDSHKEARQPLYSGQCNYIDKVFMFSSSPRSHAFMASAGVMSPIAP